MLEKLRYLLDAAFFMERMRDDHYRRILGHCKVIGREDGHPVYSLLIPALLSDSHRASLVSAGLDQAAGRRTPILANIAVTDVCDAKCENCVFEITRQSRPQMTDDQLLSAFESCRELGISTLVLVGGEPLLRPNLPEILRRFDCSRTTVVSFTNGGRLENRCTELVDAGLRRIIVSLEYPDAARHDAYTHKDGLFKAALRGIKAARRAGMLTGISVTIHADTTEADLHRFFEFAHDQGLVEIYMSREISRRTPITGLMPTDEGARAAEEANRSSRYAFGVFYYPRFASIAGFGGCSAGATRFYITPYGDVTPCDVMKRSFGNVTRESLASIWHGMTNSPGMGYASGPCRFALDEPEDGQPIRGRMFV